MKPCSKCGETKPFDGFYYRNGKPGSWCKACTAACNKAGYERNREARNRRVAEVRRARMLGLTHEEYVALGEDPGTSCSVCGAAPESRRNGRFRNGTVERATKRLAVDHCHDTGAIRGFLCGHCNRAIGMADDDPALLRAMADYIDNARANPAPWTPLASQKPGRKRNTHCKGGHPMDGPEANVNILPDGTRRCRPCETEKARKRRARA